MFSSVWTGITDLFSKFGEWIDDTVVKPVTDMLEWLWDHTIGIFSGITDRLKEMASAVSGFFGKLFSSDDMESVGGAYQTGKKEFGEDYDKRKEEEENAKKGDEDNPLAVILKGDDLPVFDLKTDVPTTPTIGGVATEKAKKKGKGVGEKSDSGNKVQSLNVGKFMDNFNVYMNAANGIDKEQLRQAIQEVFYTAVADFTGATN